MARTSTVLLPKTVTLGDAVKAFPALELFGP
jgi:hypothetical protein